jgi:hypothetical protein
LQSVISLSLWGEDPVYNLGALANCELYPRFLKNWQVWVYCPVSYNPEVVYQIRARGGRVVFVEPGDRLGMFWRYFAADHPQVQHVIFRDADSRPSEREARLVNDWIKSGKRFHIIRDHPAHFNPIMGGLWGCAGGSRLNFIERVRNLISQPSTPTGLAVYGYDQAYLANHVYPFIRDEACVHDEFFQNTDNLPDRVGLEYVGQRFNARNLPDQTHNNELLAWETLKRHSHFFKVLKARPPYQGWDN